MTREIDLHVHTSASEDGEVAPLDLLRLARKKGLKAIAFTDHDSTGSVEVGMSAGNDFGVVVLPGIEMTTVHDEDDVHILGYLLDWKNSRLAAACERTRLSRVQQARERVAIMQRLGFDIDFDRVMAVAAGRPPTSAILMAVLKENFRRRRDEKLAAYIEGEKSASPGLNLFLDYFSPGGPAYVPAETIRSAGAIEVILSARGVPVVAHPGRLAPETVLAVIDEGAAGIEVYSSNHSGRDEARYAALAADMGLVATAGSDFHGPGRKTAVLGGLRGGTLTMVDALRERHRRLFG